MERDERGRLEPTNGQARKSIADEQLILFAKSGQEFPGRSPAPATLNRWRLRGVRGVKLETLLIGGQRFTSREAIRRFIESQNQPQAAEPSMTAAERQARSAAARAVLQARGI